MDEPPENNEDSSVDGALNDLVGNNEDQNYIIPEIENIGNLIEEDMRHSLYEFSTVHSFDHYFNMNLIDDHLIIEEEVNIITNIVPMAHMNVIRQFKTEKNVVANDESIMTQRPRRTNTGAHI
mmetsp:Transcript_22471/g.21598  ORF Transcript_22471/g.21598 Transcript_22471/m.21598 type:complete len:123 (-) Transcript_22471:190-558(-)